MSFVQPIEKEDPQVSIRPAKQRSTIRVGYVGLVDAAPFLVAEAFGLFERRGLSVVLTREVGWATIREKVVLGELEAAQALCALPFLASLGIASRPVSCVSGLVVSRGGNAIVLSEELRRRGVTNPATLKVDVENRKAFRKYKFATVYPCCAHTFHLQEWLAAAGIDPTEDVELVTLPPTQMCRNLAAGTIDGFCAGEPWPSLAVSQKIGWSPACSADLSPNHPEKVLMVKESFALEREEEHLALIQALVEASRICEDVAQRPAIASYLSDRKRVNCSADLIEECVSPKFNYGLGRIENKPSFLRFHADGSNRPSAADTDWILKRVSAQLQPSGELEFVEAASRVLLGDLFDQAMANAGLAAR